MKIEQEEMLNELIMKLESVDYSDLQSLAVDAYNKALEDVLKVVRMEYKHLGGSDVRNGPVVHNKYFSIAHPEGDIAIGISEDSVLALRIS